MSGRYIIHQMVSASVNQTTLIDCVEHLSDGPDRIVSFYFDKDTNPANVVFSKGILILETRTIGGALIYECSVPEGTDPTLALENQEITITPAQSMAADYEGLCAFVGFRNDQPAKITLEWIKHHIKTQGLETVVLIDRGMPDKQAKFDKKMQAGLKKLGGTFKMVVLRCAYPLGDKTLPAEMHPYCCPTSPGKDRMEIPPPDPWASPLAVIHCYEIVRRRYLGASKATANLDICDLIPNSDDASVFDQAMTSSSGIVTLNGQSCYPWRVRNGDDIHFADHICTQFDARQNWTRWCIAPEKASDKSVWLLRRIGTLSRQVKPPSIPFYRYMNIRHPAESISLIVPKSSLIEDPLLIKQSKKLFKHKPVRIPDMKPAKVWKKPGRRVIVTTMKNEGPFILEWLAYHMLIGFDGFLVYTNDCDDHTDKMFDVLQSKGLLEHRDNPYRDVDMKPQHAALDASSKEPLVKDAQWVTCIDVDEYVNIKIGDGTLDDLFEAVPDANMISMTWRLFGNADQELFQDDLITKNFTQCAPELIRKPHVAWGFKTLFENNGIFKKMGVHRPKGLNSQRVDQLNWVNGSGQPMPKHEYRTAWRSTVATYGYDMVQLNHYAVRSAESFLVKRDRGRVNHVDRDQGLAYWFRMNNNKEEDFSIQRHIPALTEMVNELKSDPDIAAAHDICVQKHKEKISALMATENYNKFYQDLNSDRMRKLSRMHDHFGSNVFLSGPESVPDAILEKDIDDDFFFTVEASEAVH